MTMATINPPDLGIVGWSGLFMSFPTSCATLADLIHFFVRNTVKMKLNSRIIPARTRSLKSINRKSKKLPKLALRKVVTRDSKVKNFNTTNSYISS